MKGFLGIIESNMIYILLLIVVLLCLLIITIMYLHIKVKKLKKRYEFFMGANRRPDYNLETLLINYKQDVEDIQGKYSKVLDMVDDINKNMKYCIQKIGVIRYNPFEEMGGNLCFAVALLDAENNGIVLNGIHSHTGSFTYAKPIEFGVSTYVLSKEEKEAVTKAIDDSYTNMEKVIKIEKPTKYYKFKKREFKTFEEIKNGKTSEEYDFEDKITIEENDTEEIDTEENKLEVAEVDIDIDDSM